MTGTVTDTQEALKNGTDGNLLLMAAAENCRLNVIRYLLGHPNVNINGRDNREYADGATPLLWALADKPCPAGVKMLIENGADVNQTDNRGFTPLMSAVTEGWEGIVAELITAKANVNAANQDGLTALHLTAKTNIAQMLMDAGANINARDEHGHTPLDLALQYPEPYGYGESLAVFLKRQGAKTGTEITGTK